MYVYMYIILYMYTDVKYVCTSLYVSSQGKELEGGGVSGNLCIRRPWPGMARSIFGDHERFLNTYYRPYPGELVDDIIICHCASTCIYVMRKVRIRTILGFCCAKFGLALHPRISLHKARISAMRYTFPCAKCGFMKVWPREAIQPRASIASS